MRLLAQDFFCLSSSDSTAVPPSMASGRETEGGREGEAERGREGRGRERRGREQRGGGGGRERRQWSHDVVNMHVHVTMHVSCSMHMYMLGKTQYNTLYRVKCRMQSYFESTHTCTFTCS